MENELIYTITVKDFAGEMTTEQEYVAFAGTDAEKAYEKLSFFAVHWNSVLLQCWENNTFCPLVLKNGNMGFYGCWPNSINGIKLEDITDMLPGSAMMFKKGL